MKKLALVLGLVGVVASISARAETIVFNDTTGTSFGTDAYIVGVDGNASWAVDNSFTLTSTATINEVMAGIWVPTGSTFVRGTGAIYSQPFGQGTVYDYGDVTPIGSTKEATNLGGWDVYAEYFQISPLTLGPGTYYLAFLSATTSVGDQAGWDWSSNPNTSSDQWNSQGAQESGLVATTFTLYGPGNSPVPEPSSLLLLGSGAAALAGMIRRKVKA